MNVVVNYTSKPQRNGAIWVEARAECRAIYTVVIRPDERSEENAVWRETSVKRVQKIFFNLLH